MYISCFIIILEYIHIPLRNPKLGIRDIELLGFYFIVVNPDISLRLQISQYYKDWLILQKVLRLYVLSIPQIKT